MNFAAIKRANEYSPNHIMNDYIILKKTAEELSKLGANVTFYDECLLREGLIEEPFIFSMVQGAKGIEVQRKIESKKCFSVNSAESIYNCYRFNMVVKLTGEGIPFPKSRIIDTSVDIDGVLYEFEVPFWLKRGDAHAVHKEDVTLIYYKEETFNLVNEFYNRGINSAIIQEHLVGDTVKFYGVSGSDLFYYYHLCGDNQTSYDEKKLRELAIESAGVLGLEVFGGDAIITPKSEIIIIDINDWPSFAPIREKAGFEIANLLYKKGLKYE